jgi:hypothetical protein
VHLPLGEEKPATSALNRRPRRPVRAWHIDERTRRAARKGLEEARRALAEAARPPADAA